MSLWEAAKDRTKYPLSQAEFGKKYGIGGQPAVWQLLSGKRPLNIDQALKFADYLCCPVGAFSPRLEAVLERYVATIKSEGYSGILAVLTPERAELLKKYFALVDFDQKEIAKSINMRYEATQRILGEFGPPSGQRRLTARVAQNERLPDDVAEHEQG